MIAPGGVSSIVLSLLIGPTELPPPPAPAPLTAALRRVQVSQRGTGPTTFELEFQPPVGASAAAVEFGLLAATMLQPFARVVLRVQVDYLNVTLFDGFVTRRQFTPDARGTTLTVSGEDFSVIMDRVDHSREFPAMADDLVAAAVLEPWALLGVVPEVTGTDMLVPYDHVPQQASTDRALLSQLAEQNGYVFFVRPGIVPFTNQAYFGPPPRSLLPATVLTVDAGPFSTVDSMTFGHDPLAATLFYGEVADTMLDNGEPVPVATLGSTRLPPFALEDLTPWLAEQGRLTLWRDQELDPTRANLVAQSQTNLSTDAVVTATCSADTARLGQVLMAPCTVGVRGAGLSFDGLYYLAEATHDISLGSGETWTYTQTLSMTREGLGTTVADLPPIDLPPVGLPPL